MISRRAGIYWYVKSMTCLWHYRWKVRGSAKSARSVLWRTWMSKFDGNTSNCCWDISVWTKVMCWPLMRPINLQRPLISLVYKTNREWTVKNDKDLHEEMELGGGFDVLCVCRCSQHNTYHYCTNCVSVCLCVCVCVCVCVFYLNILNGRCYIDYTMNMYSWYNLGPRGSELKSHTQLKTYHTSQFGWWEVLQCKPSGAAGLRCDWHFILRLRI